MIQFPMANEHFLLGSFSLGFLGILERCFFFLGKIKSKEPAIFGVFFFNLCTHQLADPNFYTSEDQQLEPENDGLEDDFPFPEAYSQVPC